MTAMFKTRILPLLAATFLSLGGLQAQERVEPVQDTPEMREKALARTEAVGTTVGGLNAEQEEKVMDMYMQVERHLAAIAERMSHQPEADRNADMKHVYASVDAFEQRQLNEILTEGQLDQWKAALGQQE